MTADGEGPGVGSVAVFWYSAVGAVVTGVPAGDAGDGHGLGVGEAAAVWGDDRLLNRTGGDDGKGSRDLAAPAEQGVIDSGFHRLGLRYDEGSSVDRMGAARFRVGTVGGVVDRVSDISIEDIHTRGFFEATPIGHDAWRSQGVGSRCQANVRQQHESEHCHDQ